MSKKKRDEATAQAANDMFLAAYLSAIQENKITYLQLKTAMGMVRVAVFPDRTKTLAEALPRISNGNILATGDGEHYTHDGLRVIVIPEKFTHNWLPDAPLGAPRPPEGAN